MTNLAPENTFDDVPQIETDTVWKGGADGPANDQGKALTNRTFYLKNLIESLGSAAALNVDPDGSLAADSDALIATQKAVRSFVAAQIADLIASAPGVLDTLNELAAALGDDPDFAATMTTALAGKAAKAGDAGQPFSVGEATDQDHAVALGQTYQNTTPQGLARAYNTTYINSSGRPKWVFVSANSSGSGGNMGILMNGFLVSEIPNMTAGVLISVSALIQPGASYSCAPVNSPNTISQWLEY